MTTYDNQIAYTQLITIHKQLQALQTNKGLFKFYALLPTAKRQLTKNEHSELAELVSHAAKEKMDNPDHQAVLGPINFSKRTKNERRLAIQTIFKPYKTTRPLKTARRLLKLKKDVVGLQAQLGLETFMVLLASANRRILSENEEFLRLSEYEKSLCVAADLQPSLENAETMLFLHESERFDFTINHNRVFSHKNSKTIYVDYKIFSVRNPK